VSLLTASLINVACMFGAPVLFAVAACLRGGRSWALAMGAVMWACAFPLLQAVPLAVMVLTGSQIAMFTALAVTAGVVEEVSRWFWFSRARSVHRPDAWIQGVMAGVGHGGLESWWFGLMGLGLALGLATDNVIKGYVLPEVTDVLLLGLARPCLVLAHVGLSVGVWRGVVLGDRRWLYGAVLVHIALDLVGFVVPTAWPTLQWPCLAVVALCGVVGGPAMVVWSSNNVATTATRS
jgi:uncharacterized membrane protein YhfC